MNTLFHKTIFSLLLLVGGVTTSNALWVTVGYTDNPDIGSSAVIFTSPDGSTWDTPALPDFNHDIVNLNSVAYDGSGTWIAVGKDFSKSQSLLLASPEPSVAWTVVTLPPSVPTNVNLFSIAHGNGTWVAVGSNDGTNPSQPIIMTSTEGFQNWIVRPLTLPSDLTQGVLYHVAYGNGTWVAIGDAGFNDGRWDSGIILTSQDAIHWNVQLPADKSVSLPALNGNVVYQNNQWFILGSFLSDKDTAILTSKDASQLSSWSIHHLASTCYFWGATYANGQWLIVGNNVSPSGTCLLVSKDAVTWSALPQPGYIGTQKLNDIAYGDNQWIAVGAGGDAAISHDNGKDWTTSPIVASDYIQLERIIYGN